MTGSSYIPIVVPIMAFVAMACWLGMVFYAGSHPGYKHRKPQPVDDSTEPAADGPSGQGENKGTSGRSSGSLAA